MAEAAATPPEAPAAAAQPGVWIDPYRAYNFKLVIQGVTMGHFAECTGLGVRVAGAALPGGRRARRPPHPGSGRLRRRHVALRADLVDRAVDSGS